MLPIYKMSSANVLEYKQAKVNFTNVKETSKDLWDIKFYLVYHCYYSYIIMPVFSESCTVLYQAEYGEKRSYLIRGQ